MHKVSTSPPANYTRTADQNVTSPTRTREIHRTRQLALHKELLLALSRRGSHQPWASSFRPRHICLGCIIVGTSGERRQPPAERSPSTLNKTEGNTCWRFLLYRVLCCTSGATRRYTDPERELLHQGTQHLLGCSKQCLLFVSAVCGSTPHRDTRYSVPGTRRS